jgi:hypothetical protein
VKLGLELKKKEREREREGEREKERIKADSPIVGSSETDLLSRSTEEFWLRDQLALVGKSNVGGVWCQIVLGTKRRLLRKDEEGVGLVDVFNIAKSRQHSFTAFDTCCMAKQSWGRGLYCFFT